ncbi:MAG: urease accessory protein UreF [Rhodospirillaceae bacterium]|nr:urease accessory protein UreF [Rhodospirillaceae bacterium]
MPPEPITPSGLYQLLSWMSPGFPIGAYAYSHGIEFAVENGQVTNEETLRRWIEGVLMYGTGGTDSILLAVTWRAVRDGDEVALKTTAELAGAYRGTAELALENEAQGAAFIDAVSAAWPTPELERWTSLLTQTEITVSYPVAVALAAGSAGISLAHTLTAYLHGVAANLISAGVRLIPLGQTAGQRILAQLQGLVAEVAENSAVQSLEDLGSAVPMIDWTSAQHEMQYTRLFRS